MKILIVSSEMTPFAKTGGLADVVGALPSALQSQGHTVWVVLPKYARIEIDKFGIEPYHSPMGVWMGDIQEWCSVHRTHADGVPVHFVEHSEYFDRPGIYNDENNRDYEDNAKRFGFLSRAALQLCVDQGFEPDVVHANDWQTALAPAYLKTWDWKGTPLEKAASLLTFLLFAFAFAAFGLSVRASSPPSPFYTLTGLYKTVQPIDSDTTKELRELTQSKVFQDSVEGQVEVSKGKEPDTIRIRTGASNDKELSARHRMAVNLVSKNLKKIALREKNQILQFLGTAGDEEALSDQARKAILKDKIKQLESFVDGGPAPRIVPLSLDRSALESARRRLQGSAA
ncbi:MAG TPA: hypothetical protein EYO33_01315, partial [Phycisphaerales bacterium]|nr:hypothetical protein [Phycisphaerales bacterium]